MKFKNDKSKLIFLICVSIILQVGCVNKENKNEIFVDNTNKFTSVKNQGNKTAITTQKTSTTNVNNISQTSATTANVSAISSKLIENVSEYYTEISTEIINSNLFTTKTINVTSADYINKITSNANYSIIQTETSTSPVPKVESLITESERILLCNLVGREYGSDYHGNTNVPITLYEKGQVVAVVMNRVNSDEFPNNIYDVITQPNQFSGYLPNDTYSYQVTQSVIDSVDYYFEHIEEYSPDILYFEGDGSYNYFY